MSSIEALRTVGVPERPASPTDRADGIGCERANTITASRRLCGDARPSRCLNNPSTCALVVRLSCACFACNVFVSRREWLLEI